MVLHSYHSLLSQAYFYLYIYDPGIRFFFKSSFSLWDKASEDRTMILQKRKFSKFPNTLIIFFHPPITREILNNPTRLRVYPLSQDPVFLLLSGKCMHNRSVVSNLLKPNDCSLPGSSTHGDSPGKITGVGCHALLQGIFPTQGLNPGLSHCRQILYQLSHQGSPRILEWVAYPFSRESS